MVEGPGVSPGVVEGPGVDLGAGEGPGVEVGAVEGPGVELKAKEGLGVATEGLGDEGGWDELFLGARGAFTVGGLRFFRLIDRNLVPAIAQEL